MPVMSSAPLQRWARNGAALQSDDGDTCVVAYNDSADLYTYSYTIDTRRWLIVNIRKSAYSYNYFNASYSYDYEEGGVPTLTRIALRGDTTLAFGGYRFFNIETNTALDDTLFGVSVRFSRNGSPRAPFGNETTLGHRAVGYDLLGRHMMRIGGGVSGVLIEIDPGDQNSPSHRSTIRVRR